jgi:hypothetical protein
MNQRQYQVRFQKKVFIAQGLISTHQGVASVHPDCMNHAMIQAALACRTRLTSLPASETRQIQSIIGSALAVAVSLSRVNQHQAAAATPRCTIGDGTTAPASSAMTVQAR